MESFESFYLKEEQRNNYPAGAYKGMGFILVYTEFFP